VSVGCLVLWCCLVGVLVVVVFDCGVYKCTVVVLLGCMLHDVTVLSG